MLVGITGGMGSGKSVLAGLLADYGAVRVDADAVAREVVADGGVVARLLNEFGVDLRGEDGLLDRRELGRRAFRSPEGSRRLEAIMRPPLAAAIDRRLAEAEGTDQDAIVVFDAPLIYEWGNEGRFERVVVVDAGEALRVERVRQRGGLDDDEIEQRMARQMDPEEKKRRADYIIDNNGDLAALARQAGELWRELTLTNGRDGEYDK